MVLEIVIPVIAEIITDPFKKYVIAPVKRQICYAFNYGSNVEKLQSHTMDLENQKVRVQQSADEASRNGKVVYENVTKWLTNVDNAIEEANQLIGSKEQAKQKRCFVGLCPNLKMRYQLSKKADKKALAIDKLKNEQQLDPAAFSPPPRQIIAPSVYSSEALPSRVSILKQVIDALRDPNFNMIGVYGMGGVGKTTLAKEVHRESQVDKLFDVVVMVAVSQSPEIKRIQNEIAEVLGLDLNDNGMLLRANKLCERLKKENKILIILDDVWRTLQLEEVGIPFGNDCEGCKILLTSRRPDICRAMGANKNFAVEVLSDEEAWSLFEMTVADGEVPKLPPLATEVAKKCSGLPLLILIVATDLRNKEPYAWNDKLRQLSEFDDEDMQEKVQKVLESSYHNLPNNEVKSFFLLCGLFGQSNIQIHHLLEYSMGLGLFKHISTVTDARNRVARLIHDLKAECLLLDGDMDGFVKIHDVVRDTAMSIASREQQAFVGISGFQVREWPKEDCTRISLPFCDIEELPECLEYPKAEVLLLSTEDFSLKIPDLFFQGIRKLKVLNLSGMYFASLPSSFSLLANIHTLCLHQCQLKDITIIGELKQLEVLSFADSYIVELPRQIVQLTLLKLLDLSNCSKLKVIPANVLSKLSKLEELCMNNSFDQWEVKDTNNNQQNASLAELEELSQLSSLEIKVVDANVIPKSLSFNGLHRYRILIGDEWEWSGKYENSKTLKLKLLTSIHLEYGLKELLRESEDLHLDEVRGIENILYDLDGEGFPQLKNLHVRNDIMLQHIVNTTKCAACDAFPILESLFLENLRSLKNICHGQLVPGGSFGKLRILEVMKCHSITHLFSFPTARCLSQLQDLKVIECPNIEDIFIAEIGETYEMLELTLLNSLVLKNLPKLKSFYSKKEAIDDKTIVQESVSAKETDDSTFAEESVSGGNSSSLFNIKIHLPNLEGLELTELACEKIWENIIFSATSSNLTSLIVNRCYKLKHLCTTSVLKGLSQLQKLEVEYCHSMEEIIFAEEFDKENEGRNNRIVFPKLDILRLEHLSKLTRFCTGNSIEFQSLKELYIKECRKLRSFVSKVAHEETSQVDSKTNQSSAVEPLFNEIVSLSNLEVMALGEMDALESIWHNQVAADSFSKLEELIIKDCPRLSTIFPSNLLGRFQRLEKLNLWGCNSVVEIYQVQQQFNASGIENDALVFELRELRISHLYSLKHIWSKDPQGVVTFQNLHSVFVSDCYDLKNIFPASIARYLMQLERLQLWSCGVEEIVAKAEEGVQATAPCFKFPLFSSFHLSNLKNLRCFYPGKHTSEWPNLKSLKVYSCPNVTKYSSKIYGYKGAPGAIQHDISIPAPLLLVETMSPNLEELALDRQDLMLIESSDLFPAERFCSLKVIELISLGDRGRLFFRRLHKLDKLIVNSCYMEELFTHEDLAEEEQLVLVKHLRLSYLKPMKRIWKQDSRLKPLFHYLETLELDKCRHLINILPTFSSFENLSTLDVSRCKHLRKLVTVSTAKTLTRLVKLRVYSCSHMTEIVANDGDDQTDDEITFSKLKSLELDYFYVLTSFCSGNHAFNFPSLEQVIIRNCFKMKIFTRGALSTPKLQKVQLDDLQREYSWEGDLNATIASLVTIWMVSECINVGRCDLIEHVFDLEELSAENGPHGLLSKLEELELEDLPMLSHLWNKNLMDLLHLFAVNFNRS